MRLTLKLRSSKAGVVQSSGPDDLDPFMIEQIGLIPEQHEHVVDVHRVIDVEIRKHRICPHCEVVIIWLLAIGGQSTTYNF